MHAHVGGAACIIAFQARDWLKMAVQMMDLWCKKWLWRLFVKNSGTINSSKSHYSDEFFVKKSSFDEFFVKKTFDEFFVKKSSFDEFFVKKS